MLEQKDIDGIEDEIKQEVYQSLQPDNAEFLQEPIALISVVGEGMKNSIGMAAKITRSLADHEVNIETIDQGASELSIIFGVRDTDYVRAIRGLYYDLLKPR